MYVSVQELPLIRRLGENPSDLLTRADWAMYHSKRNGRDRITIDSDELETKM